MTNRNCTPNALSTTSGAVTRPRVDTYEVPEGYLLVVEVPGVRGDDVQLEIEDDLLRLRAERKVADPAEELRAHRFEFGATAYERAFRLGDEIDRDGIEASLEHGLLKLTLPKRAPETRSIPIRFES